MLANSNTATKTRQPKQEDILLARFVKQVKATRQPVKDYGDVGTWSQTADAINAAALTNQIEAALDSLTKSDPRFAKILASISATDDQEQAADQEQEQDARTRTGKNG